MNVTTIMTIDDIPAERVGLSGAVTTASITTSGDICVGFISSYGKLGNAQLTTWKENHWLVLLPNGKFFWHRPNLCRFNDECLKSGRMPYRTERASSSMKRFWDYFGPRISQIKRDHLDLGIAEKKDYGTRFLAEAWRLEAAKIELPSGEVLTGKEEWADKYLPKYSLVTVPGWDGNQLVFYGCLNEQAPYSFILRRAA